MLKFSNNVLDGVKFCLVFPAYQESDDVISLKVMKQGLGKIPPLSLCAVAGILEKFGANVKIIDASADNSSIENTIQKIGLFNPDFLGFTLATYQFHFTVEWIKRIKSHIKVPVLVGGPHARIYPKEILTHRCIDYCILGDAEEVLPRLIYSIIEKKELSSLGGVAYKINNRIKINRFFLYCNDLDHVPLPSRHLIDNSLYFSLISKYKNFTAMTSSRGCVFQCTFCDNHCMPYRAMSPKRVVDEMEVCQKEFFINEIDMFDGIFSLSKKRLVNICAEIIKRKLKVHWSIRTRADLVDQDVLKQLRRAGCMRIYYGIESGSQKILKNIRKGVTLERISYIIRLTKEMGISTFGYFMVGNYGENNFTLKETEKIMLTLPLDYIQIAPIFYPPNTENYKELVKVIKFDYWRKYTINPYSRMEFPIIGTNFNKDQLHSIVRKMYLRFYLRPRNIVKLLMALKSLDEFIRSARAFYSMFGEILAEAIASNIHKNKKLKD